MFARCDKRRFCQEWVGVFWEHKIHPWHHPWDFVSRLQSDEILESTCAQPNDYLLVSWENICHTQNGKRYAHLQDSLSLSMHFWSFSGSSFQITIFLSPENHCHTTLFHHPSIGANLESPPWELQSPPNFPKSLRDLNSIFLSIERCDQLRLLKP
jgi:hypothetical protein